MKKNYDLLVKIKNKIIKEPDSLEMLPVKEITDCVYYELHELKQFYQPEHFQSLGERILNYAQILQEAVINADLNKAVQTLDDIIGIYDMLPDVDIVLPFIERANYDRALNRHITEKTIIAIGDSHSGFFAGHDGLVLVPMINDISTCPQIEGNLFTVIHLGPCLAYNADQYGSSHRLLEKIEWIDENFLSEGDTLIVSFGEIDVRNHVYDQVKKTGKSYQEVVDDILLHHINLLTWLKERGYRVISYGPIGSTKDGVAVDFAPRVGTEVERNAAGRYYNHRLEMLCKEKGIEFFTLFYDMVGNDNITDERFRSEDGLHLGRYGYQLAMDKLVEIGVLSDEQISSDSEKHNFDTLIVVTPDDCKRVQKLYPRVIDNISYGKLCFIGSKGVGDIVQNDDAIKEHVKWVDENDLVAFDEVHSCMAEHLKSIIGDEPLPRGVTGWYYQQFLKMQYAFVCRNEYYMVWDGDTVPCKKVNMFSEKTGQPYLDLKHEYHPEYFETMGKILPGFQKVIERSFISEHMLFKCDIMKKLIADIESNSSIPGEKFWEKIINAIEPEKIYDSSFSEFETYGTYVAVKYPDVYMLREWHSFRLGGSFYEVDTITDGDFKWLSADFDAISFEKNQSVMEENKGYFDNPEVQAKISAKKLVQAVQMEYNDAYKEVWDDDITARNANVRSGGYGISQGKNNKTVIVVIPNNPGDSIEDTLRSAEEVLNPNSYMLISVDDISECNEAVNVSVGTEFEDSDVFLLRGDCILIFDALYFLKDALYSAEDIGAVGSISNKADNKQRVGVSYDTDEKYIQYGERVNVPMENACFEIASLSDFAMLIKRDVWNSIGGYRQGQSPEDLSSEIIKTGHKLLSVRNSFVYRKRR